MAHKFNPENKEKLDSPGRREVMPPEEILLQNNLQKGHALADIGCGTGYFTSAGAKIVGPEGKVLGLDTSPDMLSHLEKKIKDEGFTNRRLLLSGEYLQLSYLFQIFRKKPEYISFFISY